MKRKFKEMKQGSLVSKSEGSDLCTVLLGLLSL